MRTDDADVPAAVRRLVESQSTLVLATADPDPWCAPVYYVESDGALVFFSSPASRHIAGTAADGVCGGAIFREAASWSDIEGLQMQGRIEQLAPGDDAVGAAFLAYLAKFPTVCDLLGAPRPSLSLLMERLRCEPYAFVPGEVHYLNNRRGFAKRALVGWPYPDARTGG